jgi:hypothetical protein
MLVRYKKNSTCTIENFKDDIDNIILGNIVTVDDLSAGADKANSVIYGTYPTGTYARANNTTFTYSKDHNTEVKTNYFRLTYDANDFVSFTLAESYTSETDTLLNSYVHSGGNVLVSNIDIVVNDKCLVFLPSNSNNKFGVFDLGHNAVSRQFTSTMLMVLGTVGDFGAKALLYTYTPYTYDFDTLSYAAVTVAVPGVSTDTTRKSTGNSVAVIFESPYTTAINSGTSLLYGISRIPSYTFAGTQIYKDASDNYRITFNDNSFLVD